MGARAGLVVLLLVVVWLVVLVPVALRKLSERQLSASVDQFRHRARAIGRATPVAVPYVDPERRAWERARERSRAQRRRERRRRVLTTLLASFGASLVLGAIPALRPLWDLSLVAFLLSTGYVALLVRAERERVISAALAERAEKVVQIGEHRRFGERHRGVDADGRAIVGTLPPARPAFVVVDVQA